MNINKFNCNSNIIINDNKNIFIALAIEFIFNIDSINIISAIIKAK